MPFYTTALQKEFGIQVDYVAVKPNDDLTDLVELLRQDHKLW
jgi:cysteine desulfurase